ncbi:hypothetical protein BX666DRAFT_1880656 [Dichotomocladium elegans]|nr:hypothetical protein BX666DRAFT_1880656 [Dichotomocladium elegans]
MQPGDSDWYGDHVHDWQEICHYVSTNQVPMIRRNREGQARYMSWMKETLTKYNSIEEYMLTEKLDFSSLPPSPDPIHRPAVIILPNDFPYSTEPGIVHILIWSQTPLVEDYVQELLEAHYGSSAWEWIYFVNPPSTQSIRGLPHVHVFMRPRTLTAPPPKLHLE